MLDENIKIRDSLISSSHSEYELVTFKAFSWGESFSQNDNLTFGELMSYSWGIYVREGWFYDFKTTLYFYFLFLMGCSHKIKIEPNILPKFKFGEKYDSNIEIERLKLLEGLVIKTNLPENSGIFIEKSGEDDFYYQNTIRIHGTPKVKGNYYILLDGKFRGGALGGVTYFQKKYNMIIN